jgi:hypothetical protein
MSRFRDPPATTGPGVPANLLLQVKCYAMANRRLDLRALGERAVSTALMAPEPPHEAPQPRHGRTWFSLWRGAMQFAQERTKFLILSLSR